MGMIALMIFTVILDSIQKTQTQSILKQDTIDFTGSRTLHWFVDTINVPEFSLQRFLVIEVSQTSNVKDLFIQANYSQIPDYTDSEKSNIEFDLIGKQDLSKPWRTNKNSLIFEKTDIQLGSRLYVSVTKRNLEDVSSTVQLTLKAYYSTVKCPYDCNGFGTCRIQGCNCYQGYTDTDCQLLYNPANFYQEILVNFENSKWIFFRFPIKEDKDDTPINLLAQSTDPSASFHFFDALQSISEEFTMPTLGIRTVLPGEKINIEIKVDGIGGRYIIIGFQGKPGKSCTLFLTQTQASYLNITIIMVTTIVSAIISILFIAFLLYLKRVKEIDRAAQNSLNNQIQVRQQSLPQQQPNQIHNQPHHAQQSNTELDPKDQNQRMIIDKYEKLNDDKNLNNSPQQNLVECGICLDDIRVEDFVVKTRCSHIFHRACLEKWIGNEKGCPYCRSKFDRSDIQVFENYREQIALIDLPRQQLQFQDLNQ